MHIVTIGANAAGLRAAARAKRLLPDAAVTVIDRGKFISYGACGMPYLVSGDIEAADKLRETAYGIIRDPDFFWKAKGLEVVIQTEADRIDRGNCRVLCKSLLTGKTKAYPYDKLILATGAKPIGRAREAADRPLPEKDTKNVPFEEFRVNCDQVPKDQAVVCVCSKGVRSSEAARVLKDKGCADVKYVGGGTLLRDPMN